MGNKKNMYFILIVFIFICFDFSFFSFFQFVNNGSRMPWDGSQNYGDQEQLGRYVLEMS
jgi:hypothetical protein